MLKIGLIGLGVLILIILAVVVVSTLADNQFERKVSEEVKIIFNENGVNEKQVIGQEDLQDLPRCVQNWLTNSGIIGQEKVSTVRLKQQGILRLKPESGWLPFEAVQYFRVDQPSFIWKADIKFAPFFNIAGRDLYLDGQGHMLIKLLSLITVSDVKGPEIDQGTLMRYLAELQWFPSAALAEYLTWEEIDTNSAKVTMNYRGVTASAVYKFTETGDVAEFTGQRYMEQNGDFSLETWSGTGTEHKEFNGTRIANKGEVTWRLRQGDFTWLKWEITEIEYNKPMAY